MMKIKKGDFVRVIAGKHKNTQGQVVKILHDKNKLCLEEIKMKKHKKPTSENAKGSIVEIYQPIHVSNVMALDPKKKFITRIGYKIVGEKKFRFAKKTNQKYKD